VLLETDIVNIYCAVVGQI